METLEYSLSSQSNIEFIAPLNLPSIDLLDFHYSVSTLTLSTLPYLSIINLFQDSRVCLSRVSYLKVHRLPIVMPTSLHQPISDGVMLTSFLDSLKLQFQVSLINLLLFSSNRMGSIT